MIANERQYRIAKAELRRFDQAIAAAKQARPAEPIDRRIHAATRDALQSQAEELRRKLRRYEALKEGKVRTRKLSSLDELPNALVEGRIAAGLTQRELGTRLSLPEQQIQRYEATRYAGVSVERAQAIVEALGMKVTKHIEYAVRPRPAVASGRRAPRRQSAR